MQTKLHFTCRCFFFFKKKTEFRQKFLSFLSPMQQCLLARPCLEMWRSWKKSLFPKVYGEQTIKCKFWFYKQSRKIVHVFNQTLNRNVSFLKCYFRSSLCGIYRRLDPFTKFGWANEKEMTFLKKKEVPIIHSNLLEPWFLNAFKIYIVNSSKTVRGRKKRRMNSFVGQRRRRTLYRVRFEQWNFGRGLFMYN